MRWIGYYFGMIVGTLLAHTMALHDWVWGVLLILAGTAAGYWIGKKGDDELHSEG